MNHQAQNQRLPGEPKAGKIPECERSLESRGSNSCIINQRKESKETQCPGWKEPAELVREVAMMSAQVQTAIKTGLGSNENADLRQQLEKESKARDTVGPTDMVDLRRIIKGNSTDDKFSHLNSSKAKWKAQIHFAIFVNLMVCMLNFSYKGYSKSAVLLNLCTQAKLQ